MKVILAIALTLTTSGCAWFRGLSNSLSDTVPFSAALATAERDLNATSPVTLSDLGTTREDAITAAIKAAQCIPPRRANPLVPVITGPVSLAMQGSIQAQGGVTGSATPSITLQVTRGQQQQVTVPVTFVSAAGLADFYMGQQLTNLTNLDSGSKDPTTTGIDVSVAKSFLADEILKRRKHLNDIVTADIKAFDKDGKDCKVDEYGNYTSAPFVPQLQ